MPPRALRRRRPRAARPLVPIRSLAIPFTASRGGPALVMYVVGLVVTPGDVHGPSPGFERFGGRGLQVLAHRGERPARLQRDQVAGEHAEVDDVFDAAALDVAALRRFLAVGQQMDLLRADREV